MSKDCDVPSSILSIQPKDAILQLSLLLLRNHRESRPPVLHSQPGNVVTSLLSVTSKTTGENNIQPPHDTFKDIGCAASIISYRVNANFCDYIVMTLMAFRQKQENRQQ